ncbi:MAG TPA: AAA family ATPase, partial [Hyphomicrobiaceae bacterium]|nr:AAA family ATPase [Hyphomicrobiaceae bacterium]
MTKAKHAVSIDDHRSAPGGIDGVKTMLDHAMADADEQSRSQSASSDGCVSAPEAASRVSAPEAPSNGAGAVSAPEAPTRMYVERLTLTNFRNYRALSLTVGPEPVVLVGANGAGKTNLLEAVSLLAAGQGMRRAAFPDLAHAQGRGDWSIAARLVTPDGPLDIGTGLPADAAKGPRTGRIVRVNGETQSGSGILADLVEMVWVTPAMDGLFTGPGGDRRRFLDRLILCFDPGYRTRLGHFERAMANRNRLLADGSRDHAQLTAFESVMVETGISISAARLEAVAQISATIEARRIRDPGSPFPWAELAL